MSGPEIKHALRKMEFPTNAKEALAKTAQLICGRVPSIKHMDLALDLIAEFIFCEVDRRGNKRHQPLTPIAELQLLEVLFEYLNNTPNEAAKNTIFLSLFSGTTATLRLPILSKLVSIGIGICSSSVLVSASTWLQQLGNTSVTSCKLAEAIVRDYFVLVPSTVERLKALPEVAPQFVANFLAAVAETYYCDDNKQSMRFPSPRLLEVVTFWITENKKLCIAAQQIQSALPPGAIAMEATTPIAGLLRWCILAPLYCQDSNLYSQLHLSLLHSILEVPIANPPRAISAQHLVSLCGYILRYIRDVRNKNEVPGDVSKTDERLQLALDRYAQAIQVAFSVNCVYGNVDDLVDQVRHSLPQTKLLNIVILTYRKNK